MRGYLPPRKDREGNRKGRDTKLAAWMAGLLTKLTPLLVRLTPVVSPLVMPLATGLDTVLMPLVNMLVPPVTKLVTPFAALLTPDTAVLTPIMATSPTIDTGLNGLLLMKQKKPKQGRCGLCGGPLGRSGFDVGGRAGDTGAPPVFRPMQRPG